LASDQNVADLAIGSDNPVKNPLLFQAPTNLIHPVTWMDISLLFECVIIESRPPAQGLDDLVDVCRHKCIRDTRSSNMPRKLGSYASST
jgi:hypothetical protein